MPPFLAALAIAAPVPKPLASGSLATGEPLAVQLLLLLGRDDADLVVLAAVLARRVADGVDVQARRGGFAGQLAEAVDEFLLEVICQVVLGAEEDDAALGDFLGRC